MALRYTRNMNTPTASNELITRAEAKKIAAAVASVVPRSEVKTYAWCIKVVTRSGKTILDYSGTKKGFRKVV